MQPIGLISLEENLEDEERIGDNKRSPRSKSGIEIEQILKRVAPLNTTFDIKPIHIPYFTEFSYYDTMGGILCSTMNEEVNARVIERSVDGVSDRNQYVNSVIEYMHDKYILNNDLSYPDAKKIVFLSGSNLAYAIDVNLLDRIMFEHEDAVIKLHPVTNKDFIRAVAKKYGYHRMIDPQESGLAYLRQADTVFYMSNSEIGLVAAALKKQIYNFSSLQHISKLTFASLARMFKDGDVEHNYSMFNKILNSRTTGLILPCMEDKEDRIQAFCDLAMEIREVFRPRWPGTGDLKPLAPKQR